MSISNNKFDPYFDDNRPILRESYCIYADMMGFTNMIEEAALNGKEVELLKQLYDSIANRCKYFNPTGQGSVGSASCALRYKILTDNLVLAYPILNTVGGEFELVNLIDEIMSFQLSLALDGFFLRGGISYGPLHLSNEIVYGSAILQAYYVESKLAEYPGIAFHPDLKAKLKDYQNYYKDPKFAWHEQYLINDNRGFVFLNYLAILGEEDYFLISDLEKHKLILEAMLSKYKTKQEILNKYNWLASYHNYFCRENMNKISDHKKYFIPGSLPNFGFKKYR